MIDPLLVGLTLGSWALYFHQRNKARKVFRNMQNLIKYKDEHLNQHSAARNQLSGVNAELQARLDIAIDEIVKLKRQLKSIREVTTALGIPEAGLIVPDKPKATRKKKAKTPAPNQFEPPVRDIRL